MARRLRPRALSLGWFGFWLSRRPQVAELGLEVWITVSHPIQLARKASDSLCIGRRLLRALKRDT